MRHFVIIIDGVPPVMVADKFWVEIARFDVNFMVLDKQSFIYGDATDKTIGILLEKSSQFGFNVKLDRGEAYDY